MVTQGVKVLVIAAIDGTTLSDILQKSAIPVLRSLLMIV